MDIYRHDEYGKYVIIKVLSNNEWKYGIVDKYNGKEYIALICDWIAFHKNSKLIEFSIEQHSALCHIKDFEKYTSTL